MVIIFARVDVLRRPVLVYLPGSLTTDYVLFQLKVMSSKHLCTEYVIKLQLAHRICILIFGALTAFSLF